jgi:hypothetical protein
MSYINSITLPSQIFATPAASILLPVAFGTAVGYSIRREIIPLACSGKAFTVAGIQIFFEQLRKHLLTSDSDQDSENLYGSEATSLPPTTTSKNCLFPLGTFLL